ncbi:molybdopterin-dependent oxidoreductase [Sulfurovum mangrovi]|uniref:molybdopterin-dependent oxidoreductase n=1 Tax=Sulfurovum mangrovi TaxID=2893889 RepID=UPI001E29B73A|nr:molybdopterin-dependent oxidoreductase [Sulfurovum mangrovi]UFH58033.1 molybdopterin-dependent oxidoreductase [Sulfurovum mangrovi]
MKSILYIALLTTLIFAKPPFNDTERFVTKQLRVEGKVLQNVILDREKIRQLPQFHSKKSAVVCMSGETKAEPTSFSGVLLKDILDLAKIKIEHQKEMNTIYVIAQARDGYKALFSYHEIYNTAIGEKIVVYYEKDGKPLDKTEGDFALISLNDKKNGPRDVKWLEKIIIKSDQ